MKLTTLYKGQGQAVTVTRPCIRLILAHFAV